MNKDELEVYVNQQFDQLHHLVRLEEKRTLHLVDLKEAFLTAQASEMIAEISVNTERLQEEVDCITQQLGELEQAEAQGGPQAAGTAAGPDGADAPGAGAEPAAAGAAVAGHQAEAAVAAPVPAPLPAAMAQGLRLAVSNPSITDTDTSLHLKRGKSINCLSIPFTDQSSGSSVNSPFNFNIGSQRLTLHI